MRNFGSLYCYEWKKIVQRKMTWIAFLITLAMSLLGVFSDVTGKYYVDGVVYETYYEMMQKDNGYARALSGRAVNRELIDEMTAAYGKVPYDVPRYSLTDEYQTYARPYSEIYHFVRKIMKASAPQELLALDVDEETLFEQFRENIVKICENNRLLTDGERQFWIAKADTIKQPFVFGYARGYQKLISLSYTAGFLIMMMVAICLSDLFAKEHTFRTDQLLLSSRFGKKELFFAKILAGMSFAGASAIMIWLAVVVAAFGLYGTDGGDVIIQFMFPDYPMELRVDTMVAIVSALMLLGVLLVSMFVMALSEIMHNALATLAVAGCVVLLPLFMPNPFTYRLFAQIWAYLPSNLLDWDNILGLWLVPFFGGYLTTWQALPFYYFLAGVFFFLCGIRGYRNYQVSGR